MKQAQQMQDQMMQAQEKLKEETVDASAGGGMVKVTIGGDMTLRAITIDPRLEQHALEGIVAAGGDRDAGDVRRVAVPVEAVARQVRELLVDGVVGARGDAGERHFAAPLPHLHDERDVRPRPQAVGR